MHTFHLDTNDKTARADSLPWQEPAIAFERPLMAVAQGGPGPHGAPSGLLGPLATSGSTTGGNDCG